MALQGEMTLPSGIALPSAYLKIERVVDNRSARAEHHVSIEANLYASAEARATGKDPAANTLHTCCAKTIDPETGETADNPAYAAYFAFDALNLPGANPIANGYRFLKTLPEFYAMTDC